MRTRILVLMLAAVMALGCASTITKSGDDTWTASVIFGSATVKIGSDDDPDIEVKGGEISAEGAGIVSRALGLLSSFLPPVVAGALGGD
jgi:hypothetical protein